MGKFSSMRLTRSAAPSPRIAPAIPPHASSSLPMREPRCVNSGILPKSTSRHFPSSCNQAAGRAFWKYRCFANSLLSDERQQSRSTADVGTALFEQPQRATIQITQDRVCCSLHVVGHWRRMAAVSSSLRTGRIFGRAAAGRNVRDFPDDFPDDFPPDFPPAERIYAAGRHSARFHRNCHARHQSGRSFAKYAHGELCRL